MVDQWKAPSEAEPTVGDDKSWKLLEKTLLAGIQEQRRSRRWGIFFKLLTFFYLIAMLFLFTPLLDMERSGKAIQHYDLQLYGAADEIVPKLIKGELDMAAIKAFYAPIQGKNPTQFEV